MSPSSSDMVNLHSNQTVAFFLLGAVMLAMARICGELALKCRQPVIIGEILAGILLGPSVFGYFFPDFSLWLFPRDGDASTILEGFSALAVSLLLLVAGLEVDVSKLWRQGRCIALTSSLGFILPFIIGVVAAAYLLPPRFGGSKDVLFVLFIGTALTISSLPVIARILLDVKLFKSRVGTVIMSSAMIDDLIGWILLSVLLTLSTATIVSFEHVGRVVALTLAFTISMVTVGRWLTTRVLGWAQSHLTWPGGVIGLVLVFALAGSAVTEAIGIQAVFGAFLAGIAMSDSNALTQSSGEAIKLFVLNFFSPIYFTMIGLKINFIEHLDLPLIAIILVLATVSKVAGSSLGAYWGGMSKHESLAVGFGMSARGMMQIIFGTLAFQYGLIDETILVAFVVLAIATSLASGPMLLYTLGRRSSEVALKPVSA